MFIYEKKLQFPVRIQNTNPRLAGIIISQYGGPVPNRLQSTVSPNTLADCPARVFYSSYHGSTSPLQLSEPSARSSRDGSSNPLLASAMSSMESVGSRIVGSRAGA